jgi:propionaldehyde dehydrogenase
MTLSFDERRIAEIVQKVVADLKPQEVPAAQQPARPAAQPQPGGQGGVYGDIDTAIHAARAAQLRLAELPMERRADLIAGMRQAATENAAALAHTAWQETGMGRYEDKIEKNLLVAERTRAPSNSRPGPGRATGG